MKINPDLVPRDLDHAVSILKESIQDEKEKKTLQDSVGLHFSLGMWLRNMWSLWDRDTILVKWFLENLNIVHADDISGTILEALSSSLKGEEFDARGHVLKYIEYWKKLGVDPTK